MKKQKDIILLQVVLEDGIFILYPFAGKEIISFYVIEGVFVVLMEANDAKTTAPLILVHIDIPNRRDMITPVPFRCRYIILL